MYTPEVKKKKYTYEGMVRSLAVPNIQFRSCGTPTPFKPKGRLQTRPLLTSNDAVNFCNSHRSLLYTNHSARPCLVILASRPVLPVLPVHRVRVCAVAYMRPVVLKRARPSKRTYAGRVRCTSTSVLGIPLEERCFGTGWDGRDGISWLCRSIWDGFRCVVERWTMGVPV